MSEAEPLETIHLYIVREDETQPIVDSSVQDTTKIDTLPLVLQPHQSKRFLVPLMVLAVNLLIILAVFFIHIYPILTATATIIIIPKSAVVTEQLTLANVQSRVFQPVRLTQIKTVPATGKEHQDASQATGTITLYNAAPSEQTIDAGTLFIGSDGVHIVTDQIAVIPGATPPIEGQIQVSAHAVNKGSGGNIQAGDISGACCREYVFAYNSQFQGGADSRDYTVVTQQDVQGVVSSVLPFLTQNIQTSFHQQIRPGEILTPNQCSQKVSADRNVGDEAAHVTIHVTESCVAGAYNQQSLQLHMTKAFLQQVTNFTGKGYILHSLNSPSINPIVQKDHLLFTLTCQGDLIYHLSVMQLQQLREALAGKTRQQGIAILSQLHGADHISVQMEKNGTFPTNPTHIHILIVS